MDESKIQVWTYREVVLARRRAVAQALVAIGQGYTVSQAEAKAALWHPLPKITRPRVVSDVPSVLDVKWRVRDGVLERSDKYSHGFQVYFSEASRLIADLYKNPTEEVEDDGSTNPEN